MIHAKPVDKDDKSSKEEEKDKAYIIHYENDKTADGYNFA